jgi:hypothetical protein
VALSLAAAWVGAIAGLYFAQPFVQYLFPGQTFTAGVALLNVLFLIAIPLISVILFVSRLLFGTYVSHYWNIGLGVFWWLNLSCLAIIGGRSATEFKSTTEITQPSQFLQPDSDTLHLQEAVFNYDNSRMAIENDVFLMDDALVYKAVDLVIEKAEGNQFELVQHIHAKGRDLQNAKAMTEVVSGSAVLEQHTLSFDPYVKIPQGQLFRAQSITWRLKVPEGKSVVISEDLLEMIDHMQQHPDAPSWWDNTGKVWTMGAEGLTTE